MLKNRLAQREGIHLALGGGAARGLAHIGIIKALQAHHVPIASICGTSMGALVGAAYALHPDAEVLEKHFLEFVQGEVYNRARYAFLKAASKAKHESRRMRFGEFIRHGYLLGKSMAFGSMVPLDEFKHEVAALVADKGFNRVMIPFFATAVDLTSRTEVVFDRGRLRYAVMASCAIPGVFPSIVSKGSVYVDGGWMNRVPIMPLKGNGAVHVLGVDVAPGETPAINPKRGVSIMWKAYGATHYRLQQLQMSPASILWRPPVASLHWADFNQVEKAAELGYEFAQQNMTEVKRLLDEKPKWWRRLRKRSKSRPWAGDRYWVSHETRGIWEIEAEPG